MCQIYEAVFVYLKHILYMFLIAQQPEYKDVSKN